MIIKNITGEDLSKTLSKLNQKYENNIIWNNYKDLGKNRFRITLRCVSDRGKGSRLATHYIINGYKGTKGAINHLIDCCWHCHGDFFDTLLAINPKAIIQTNTRKIHMKNGEIIGNWQDRNIGSAFQPLNYSQACECNKTLKFDAKTINQNKLTSECWLVQINGIKECEQCEYKNKKCGGQNIRKTGKNKLGFKVEINE